MMRIRDLKDVGQMTQRQVAELLAEGFAEHWPDAWPNLDAARLTVRERGGLTIWLGSDDEDDMTSLAGVDLFPDPLAHLAAIRNYKGHPYEFYRKVGFSIAGVLPDANGLGKPDIFLAKSVTRR